MAWRWFIRLVVIISGAAASLAFPEPAWWWWGWVGLVPILVLIGRAPTCREALMRSWLGGAGFLTTLHYWLTHGFRTPEIESSCPLDIVSFQLSDLHTPAPYR